MWLVQVAAGTLVLLSRAAPEGLAAALGRGEISEALGRIPLDGTDLMRVPAAVVFH